MSPDRLRIVVSQVLVVGVITSATLIAIGFVGSLVVGWEGSLSGQPALDQPITDFSGLVDGLQALRPVAIAQLGLIVLVATPIVRVVASLVGFALEGDRLYVAITAGVLAILLASALLFR